ncbi:alpha/beta hydrolase [Rhizobium sp. S-51]|uniref:Alpha/beta hydrolase n=1 Tax=Rhizobium terricola TaxID=2728849 RepID=A0A7Y0AVL1_9HYPH|nr:alpha/beta hydrolase [Rhizobium terricola]NML74274.1 alpha/beta hydrolase [Rhizobium terricola]
MTAGYDQGFVEQRVATADGLTLYTRIYGAGLGGLPVVCLPGLTRNSRDFHQLAIVLSTAATRPRRVITIDSRGRGRSDWDEDKSRYTLPVEAGDVVSVLDALQIDRAGFIGTSRGGLILHLLAASHADRIAGAVLNDIGPVIELEGLRQIQAYLGRDRRPDDVSEATTILKEIHGPSFPALGEGDWRDMADAIYRERDGRIVADFDPAIADQVRALDLSQPVPDLWPLFETLKQVPLMTVRGATSRLLSAETLKEMTQRAPDMEALTVPGQGHAPILHVGDIPARLAGFLDRRVR